jgi:hypothetical protein
VVSLVKPPQEPEVMIKELRRWIKKTDGQSVPHDFPSPACPIPFDLLAFENFHQNQPR